MVKNRTSKKPMRAARSETHNAPTAAALPKVVKRSTIVGNLQSALNRPGIEMKTQISSLPGAGNKLQFVYTKCVNFQAFTKNGMTLDNFPWSTVEEVDPAPTTLGGFETGCLEPWYKQQGWTVDTKH